MKVILLCTITLNGKIAKNEQDNTDWTTKGNKRLFALETKKAGVMIMGHKTYKTLGKPLPGRLNVVMTRNVSNKSGIGGLVEFTDDTVQNIVKLLEKRGFESVFVIGGRQINSLFLGEGLLDEIWLIVEPIVFGSGIDLFANGVGEKRLKLASCERIKEDLLFVKYTVH